MRPDGSGRSGQVATIPYRDECGKCGARRVDSQLGLEATPELYVERLVAVMREVWRCLRADGTLFLNLGDTYASAWPCQRRNEVGAGSLPNGKREARPARMPEGLKEKDLVGVPWRVAFALQADGWYLRSDIIWAKPNPMPESVTDRPTKAHEYVFLLAKQPKYYWDADAIREAATPDGIAREGRARLSAYDAPGQTANRRTTSDGAWLEAGRNARSVWEIATQPTPEAHFATYPEALVRRCILAGSKPGDTVLDPFVGSGTTCLVARKHGRRAIGIDLSLEYLAIAARRTQQLSLLGEGAA